MFLIDRKHLIEGKMPLANVVGKRKNAVGECCSILFKYKVIQFCL